MYTILEVSGVCLISPEICFAMKKKCLKKGYIKQDWASREQRKMAGLFFYYLWIINIDWLVSACWSVLEVPQALKPTPYIYSYSLKDGVIC